MKKGQGAQINPHSSFEKQVFSTDHIEGIDDHEKELVKPEIIFESPKTVVNKVTSPDVGMMYSVNPYQGCEHGCVYCYARTSHEYWGFSPGVDFERKIVVKKTAPALLEKFITRRGWTGHPIAFSGNTDCYQPLEKQFQLTRQMLNLMRRYKHACGIITKNSLIQRDIDIISELAAQNLIQVNVSINSLNEEVRRKLEARTATHVKRLETIRKLSEAGVTVNVLVAPIIPGLTDHEIPELLKSVSEAGAGTAGYIVVRLNGQIGKIFENWLRKAFPDRADKIMNQIRLMHGGKTNDSRFGMRMKGEGQFAEHIKNLFAVSYRKYFPFPKPAKIDVSLFQKGNRDQMSLF